MVAVALLDRLLSYAIMIQVAGNCYRLGEYAKLVPDSLRLPPVSGSRRKCGDDAGTHDFGKSRISILELASYNWKNIILISCYVINRHII